MKVNFLFVFAIIALAFAFVNFSVSLTRIVNMRNVITGMTGIYGYVNLTVEGAISINFTDDYVNWSSGQVQSPNTFAWLYSNGTVAGGNWTAESSGLRIENVGTVNVTLALAAGKTAANFIGGTTPAYQWNMSQLEAGSCVAAAGTTLGAYSNANGSQTFCRNFSHIGTADLVRLDIGVKVPENAPPGAKEDTITATATGPSA